MERTTGWRGQPGSSADLSLSLLSAIAHPLHHTACPAAELAAEQS